MRKPEHCISCLPQLSIVIYSRCCEEAITIKKKLLLISKAHQGQHANVHYKKLFSLSIMFLKLSSVDIINFRLH